LVEQKWWRWQIRSRGAAKQRTREGEDAVLRMYLFVPVYHSGTKNGNQGGCAIWLTLGMLIVMRTREKATVMLDVKMEWVNDVTATAI
jgi:hypothetical protein